MLRRGVVVLSCAGVFVGGGVTGAYAGEITGTGISLKVGDTPFLHGNSECAFSGLNDDWVLATDKTDIPHTQTPKGAKQIVGYACNPSGKRG